MRESVSDQWAISKWVGSDTGLITGSILKVHTRQNYPVCLNNSLLWGESCLHPPRFIMPKSCHHALK